MPSPWARLRVDTDVGKAPTVAYNSCVRIGVIYYTMSYTYPITCLTLPSIHALVVETGSAKLTEVKLEKLHYSNFSYSNPYD
jgi:hypothetical protein